VDVPSGTALELANQLGQIRESSLDIPTDQLHSTVLKKPEEQDSMAPRFIPYGCPGMSLQQKLYLGWMIRNL